MYGDSAGYSPLRAGYPVPAATRRLVPLSRALAGATARAWPHRGCRLGAAVLRRYSGRLTHVGVSRARLARVSTLRSVELAHRWPPYTLLSLLGLAAPHRRLTAGK